MWFFTHKFVTTDLVVITPILLLYLKRPRVCNWTNRLIHNKRWHHTRNHVICVLISPDGQHKYHAGRHHTEKGVRVRRLIWTNWRGSTYFDTGLCNLFRQVAASLPCSDWCISCNIWATFKQLLYNLFYHSQLSAAKINSRHKLCHLSLKITAAMVTTMKKGLPRNHQNPANIIYKKN